MASNEPQKNEEPGQDIGQADFAKALQEIAKGERTATALENSLSSMEAKIEALLQQAEKAQEEIKGGSKKPASTSSDDTAEK